MGVKIFPISGGELESAEAGEPAALLRRTYLKAGESVSQRECVQATVIINDFDTGGGNWGPLVQTTVNSQTLFGELMHLCDSPNFVEHKICRRIPIIITGNDFTKLYPPLTRSGRMTLFEWIPEHLELADMLRGVFRRLSPEEIMVIVNEFPGNQISFFSHLLGMIFERELAELVSGMDPAEALSLLLDDPRNFTLQYELEGVLNAGHELAGTLRISNHLDVECTRRWP